MDSTQLSRVAMERGILPEGIGWDSSAQRLTWVDIELGRLHIAGVDDRAVRLLSVLELGDQLGCALPSADGGWVCGLGRSLARVDRRGTVEATPALLGARERFNDGHVDAEGRLVIGTLNSDGPDGRQRLFRVEHSGAITVISDTVGISNGLAWSPDGTCMYHADTAARVITRRSYGEVIGAPTIFADIDGMPDGIAADTYGNLWVTVFDSGRLDCYDASGSLRPERSIVLPDAHLASVGFAGPDLDMLVLATGMPIMPQWLRRRRRDDGWIFTTQAPTRGLSSHSWTPAPLPLALPPRAEQ